MIAEIDRGKKPKDTLGGIVQVVARNVPVGLGSHVHWDRQLDGRIAQAMMSIPSAKGVSMGDAFELPGNAAAAHTMKFFMHPSSGFFRNTNRAGGTEGGMTTGQELRMLVALKPLSTLMKPLDSVDLLSKHPEQATVERSDICAVPAGGVVAEAMLCLVLADALLEKFVRRAAGSALRSITSTSKNTEPLVFAAAGLRACPSSTANLTAGRDACRHKPIFSQLRTPAPTNCTQDLPA